MTPAVLRRPAEIPNPFSFSDKLWETIAYVALVLGIAVVVLLLTMLVARAVRKRLRRGLERAGFQVNVSILLSRALSVAVWATGLILILYLLGVGLTPVAAFIGVVGLAASLSLQAVLQNLVAGVYLLAERPFKIGDVVRIVGPNGANHQGEVVDVQMRTTWLRSPDNELVLVPNSVMFSGVVTNRTAGGGYVSHVEVTFPRSVGIDHARDTLLPLVAQPPGDPYPREPELRVEKVTRDDWTAIISFWSRQGRISSQLLWEVSQAFPEATVSTGDSS